MPLRILEDEPVCEPASTSLANQTPDQQRNAQHQPRLRSREAVELAEELRTCVGEHYAAVAEGGHVVETRDRDA